MLACLYEITHNRKTHKRHNDTMRLQKYTPLILLIASIACVANSDAPQQSHTLPTQQNTYQNSVSLNPTSESPDEFEKKAQILESQIEARLNQQASHLPNTDTLESSPRSPDVTAQPTVAAQQIISTDDSTPDRHGSHQVVVAATHAISDNSIATSQLVTPTIETEPYSNQTESPASQETTTQPALVAYRDTEITTPSVIQDTNHHQTATITDQSQEQPMLAVTPNNVVQKPTPIETPPRRMTTTVVAAESPWERFLVATISLIHGLQASIQSYFSIIFSRQGIPLLIIIFGSMLLSVVIWFAYSSFKTEQSKRIKNLINQDQQSHAPEKPDPLAMAYAEESSGDFDVFATSEGVPIKLDLAQAYINMQDIEGAKTVLQDIIAQHRGKVVTAAQEMLKKITTG